MRRLTMRHLLFLFMLCTLQSSSFAEKILIFRQDSPHFKEVVNAVKSEINNEFTTVEYILKKDSTYLEFKNFIIKEQPQLLLLLDNMAVNYAKKFNSEKSLYAQSLRSVAAMALNLRKELRGNKNICGIEYEVPAYTIITQFRSLITDDIKNVLVFYRKSQHLDMIQTTAKQLLKEGIELKALNAEEYGQSQKQINFFLKQNMLREVYKTDTDLVWVIPDSALLNQNNFADIWIRAARKNKKPFVTGIKAFASTDMNFCLYSASPNHEDLGTQIAEQIFTLMDNSNLAANELGVEYILSVLKNMNMKILPKYGLKTIQDEMTDVEANK